MQALLALLLCTLAAVVLPAHGRLSWRKNDDLMKQAHTAFDLTELNFNQTLSALPPTYVCVIEFYASWCPHCHHYAVEYEQAARFFKLLGELREAEVFVGRVDCADHVRLCGAFRSLMFYPAVGVAPASKWLTRNDTNLTFHHQIKAANLTLQVSKAIGRPLQYFVVPAPPSNITAHSMVETAPALPQPVWTMTDVESATRMLWHFIVTTPRMHTGPDKRKALLQLLQWWAVSHPSPPCKAAAGQAVQHYDQLWPAAPTEAAASSALQTWDICGAGPWTEGPDSWVGCRSNKPGLRGFTCGLWLLFHTSAARLPPPNASQLAPGQIMMVALRAFALHFFLCDECQRHFSQVMMRPSVDEVRTQDHAVLWLWQTHNEVNARLAQEEQSGPSASGDPDHPKVQWPSFHQCPDCVVDSEEEMAALGKTRERLHKAGKGVPPPWQGPKQGEPVQWDTAAVLLYLNRTFMEPSHVRLAARGPSGMHASAAGSSVVLNVNSSLAGTSLVKSSLLLWPVVAVLVAAGLFIGWTSFLSTKIRTVTEAGGPNGRSTRRGRAHIGMDVAPANGTGHRRGTVSSVTSSASNSGNGSPRRK